MLTLTNIQSETESVYEPERQERYDLECALIDDPNKICNKIDLERKFVNFSRAFRYLNYFAKGVMTLLPLAAYINPDYNGVEHLVAGMVVMVSIPTAIGLGYVVPARGIKKTENEYKRRVSVLEQRLEELER